MEKVYYDPRNPGSFSSIANLARAASVRRDQARTWLLGQDTYTLHRQARKRFPRNRFYVDNIDELWQADLCDMRSLSEFNDGYKYLLTCIDVFSRFAWIVPLKTKQNTSVIEGFERILASGRKCIFVQFDKGMEFLGGATLKFFKRHGIKYYTTRNPDTKAAIVERFHRTIKARMWRYLTYKNTYRYIDVLDLLVEAYNNSYHTTIKMRPVDVNKENVLEVWRKVYSRREPKIMPRLKKNTKVRIARERSMFEKGYETYFSE